MTIFKRKVIGKIPVCPCGDNSESGEGNTASALDQFRKSASSVIPATCPGGDKSKLIRRVIGKLPNPSVEQVQSDWNQSDNTKPDYIKNKPTIPEEVTVDTELSDTSENPVQNKAVKHALDQKVDKDGQKVLSDNNYSSEEKQEVAKVKDKQDKLVSGQTIKTINGQSLLGEGNIQIEGGGGNSYTKQESDAKYQPKVAGKGLSTNDYTNQDKEKVAAALTEHQDISGKADNTSLQAEVTRATTAEENLRQLYNNLQQSQPIPVTSLPATGEAGKIYRLAGTTSYADYMYAEGALTTPIKMAEYNNAIDEKPTVGSNNLVKSGGAAEMIRATYDNVMFQTIITYVEQDDSSIALTIPATSANANQFGYTYGTFSVILRIRGIGSQTVTVPRLSYLVSNPVTGYIDVVNDSTLLSSQIILFSNFGGAIRNATGPIADYLRWLDTRNSLNYIIPQVTARNIAFGTKIKCTNIDPLTVYIPTYSNTRNDFGWFNINGSSVTLKCNVGGQTFEIPRLYSLVASTSGSVSVTDDKEVIKNSIVLLFNPGGQNGTLETATGPLAEHIRNLILLEEDGEDVLPAYYDEYMQDKITAINNEEYNANSNIDSFVFITDTHDSHNALKSPLMIKQIMQETSCRKMFYGGDAIWAYTNSASDTPESAKQQIIDGLILHNNAFVKPIIPVGSIFNARGNHDLTIRILNSDPSIHENLGYTFGHIASRNNMVRNELSLPNVYFNEDDNTCYYYIDNKNSKTRYLVCDGQSKPEILVGNVAWGNDYAIGISDTQLAWIKESLLSIPDGYNLVVINHEGVVYETHPTGYQWYANILNEFIKLKNATYEYSEKTVNNVIVLSGHWHQDLQVYKEGILHIGTSSDVIDAYRDMFGYAITRTKGTVTEQLFDYFINDFENDIIKVKRFGAGFDRTFHLNPIQLSVGGTATVVPVLEASSYVSYDTSGNSYNNGTWTLSNTIVSVNNGVVTALQEGDAIVVAIDNNGNKEFYYIKVI